MQRNQAQRQSRADLALGDGCENDATGAEVDRVSKLAGDYHIARADRLLPKQGDSTFSFEVISQTPLAVDPRALAGKLRLQRCGEVAIGVRMLIVHGGESQAQDHLRGESYSEPSRIEPGYQQRDRRGDGKQIAGRSGEEDPDPGGEEDCDPGC